MASVVIPTKDEEKIFETIERTKENDPDEIIVVNDTGSSEKYSSRLKAIQGIRYIECEGGTAEARNKGARATSSDKILFLDADCYPTEGWCQKMSDELEKSDIVEGEVEYIGEKCLFSRIVENLGDKGRFLTANLGVKKKVFEEVEFDEDYPIFREDTDFGIRAIEKGYQNSFCDAKVEHDAGKLSLSDFIQDQKRYKTEPYFVKKFQDSNHLDEHVSKFSRFLYPKEFLATGLIFLMLVLSVWKPVIGLTGLTIALVLLSSGFSVLKIKTSDAKFCLKDFLRGLYILPAGMFVKRYSIWKGAYKNKFLVI